MRLIVPWCVQIRSTRQRGLLLLGQAPQLIVTVTVGRSSARLAMS